MWQSRLADFCNLISILFNVFGYRYCLFEERISREGGMWLWICQRWFQSNNLEYGSYLQCSFLWSFLGCMGWSKRCYCIWTNFALFGCRSSSGNSYRYVYHNVHYPCINNSNFVFKKTTSYVWATCFPHDYFWKYSRRLLVIIFNRKI